MPEGVGYGPQNTASVGKDIHVIGNHVYAFSGVVNVVGSQSAAGITTLLFTSGNYYAKIKVTFSNTVTSATANEFYLIKMNGVEVYKAENEHAIDTYFNPTVINMIIPPFTTFESLVGSSTDGYDFTTMIAGRLYGKVD